MIPKALMGIDDPAGATSDASDGAEYAGPLRTLRAIAQVAVAVGALGSLVFLFRAGTNTPRLLLIGFVFWVLSPFAALAWATKASKRWSTLVQATLYGVAVVVTLASLAFYGGVISLPAGSAPAARFVAVAPASWVFMAILISAAALVSRRK